MVVVTQRTQIQTQRLGRLMLLHRFQKGLVGRSILETYFRLQIYSVPVTQSVRDPPGTRTLETFSLSLSLSRTAPVGLDSSPLASRDPARAATIPEFCFFRRGHKTGTRKTIHGNGPQKTHFRFTRTVNGCTRKTRIKKSDFRTG